MMRSLVTTAVLAVSFYALVRPADAQQPEGLIGNINLMTSKGCEEVKGEWRYAEVTTGVGEKKNEIEPKAHGTFDDAKWEVLKPESLGQARGPGKYSWCWYRIQVTIPDSVDGKPFTGAVGLGKALHDNPALTSCLVKRAYSYGSGSPASNDDKALLDYYDARFGAEGYRLPALLRAITMSDAFARVAVPKAQSTGTAAADGVTPSTAAKVN